MFGLTMQCFLRYNIEVRTKLVRVIEPKINTTLLGHLRISYVPPPPSIIEQSVPNLTKVTSL